MRGKIHVMLVEDDLDWVEGIKWVLEEEKDIEVVTAVADKEAALQMLRHIEVDIVLLDIMLNGITDGITAIHEILQINSDVKIIMLSCLEDRRKVWDAFSSGAVNYIVKSSECEVIPRAIREAYHNKSAIHASSAALLRREFVKLRQVEKEKRLTSREREVLSYVYAGKTSKEISSDMYIEKKTIDNHIANSIQKLGVKNRKEAAQIAKSMGLLDEKILMKCHVDP